MDVRTPSSIILKPSPGKLARNFILVAACAVLGVFTAASGEKLGWLLAVFFGLGLLVFPLQMLPGSTYLRLTKEGFEMSSLYRKRGYRWSDVSGFSVGQVSKGKMVVFGLSEQFQSLQGLRRASKKITGYEAALPDNYGMRYEDLAALMNQYKEEAGA